MMHQPDIRRDIRNEEDIKIFVNDFYDKAKQDPLLGPIFLDFIDFNRHLPVIYTFWSAILFKKVRYQGAIKFKHMILPVKEDHFTRWIELFTESVDTYFKGRRASRVKKKANRIAQVLMKNMA